MRIVKEYQKYFLCYCPNPLHHDSHPSCLWYKDTGFQKCLTCGWTGQDKSVDYKFFQLPFEIEPIKFYELSQKSIDYLYSRGIYKIPDYAVDNQAGNGVSFLQREINGEVKGLFTRLYNPIGKMRYYFEGEVMPFTGDFRPYFENHYPIVAFEKIFGMLKARQTELPFTFISTNGVNVKTKFWDKFDRGDIVFIFDDDYAGQQAKERVKKLGFIAKCSSKPTDEISNEEMIEVLEYAKSLVLR